MLELRRQRAVITRLAALTIAIGGLFYLAGKNSPSELLAAMIGSSIGVVLIVPMGIARDKLEGTLDFICALPVEPREIAASRLVATALLALPWSMGVGALSMALRSPVPLNPVIVATASLLILTALGATLAAFFALFEFEQLLGAPLFAMVVFVVLAPRAIRWMFPHVSVDVVRGFLNQPGAPLALTAAAIVIIVSIGFASYAAIQRGFARYRPRTG
jgi:hypothetical protein